MAKNGPVSWPNRFFNGQRTEKMANFVDPAVDVAWDYIMVLRLHHGRGR